MSLHCQAQIDYQINIEYIGQAVSLQPTDSPYSTKKAGQICVSKVHKNDLSMLYHFEHSKTRGQTV